MISQSTLHRLNNVLSFAVILLALYILITPYLPEAELLLKTKTEVASKTLVINEQRKENAVVIEKIGVNAPILEGSSAAVLDSGIWRRPMSAKPGEGSNIVLVGHRFLYTSGTNTFYHLPKLVTGDGISIFWNGEEKKYRVIDTRVVTPSETDIEAPTETELLTIYTCTPLWNPTHRFVVHAKPL